MKKIFTLLALIFFTLIVVNIHAQNTFPANGRAGIYTTSPAASLQIKGGARIGTTANYVNIDSATGNLSFVGTSAYRVAGNKYAFQYAGNTNYGLFFNSTNVQYEFRNGSAVPVFSVNANTGSSVFNGTLKVGAYTLPTTDGTNGQILKTNGAGVLTWSPDNGGSTGANTSLSNLTSTTAINTSLFPGTNGSVDLGSPALKWRNAYLTGYLNAYTVAASSGGDQPGVSGTSTTNYGVYGNSGYLGVYGTGTHYGVYGFSTDSIGTVGASTGTSSNSYGVLGYNPNNIGVFGNGGVNGVYGVSISGNGVYGLSASGIGVYGYSNAGNGLGYGVYGQSDVGGAGVQGKALDGYGVKGYGWIGVYGATSESATSYAGYFVGSVYSTINYQTSDGTLKQNIRDFSSAMDIINRLHPTQYEFRQDGNYKLMNLPKGSHYGLIAQEVEKVLPNLIKQTTFDPAMAAPPKKLGTDEKINAQEKTKADTISFKALNYTELIPIVIKGMQELSEKNDEKDKLISDLQNQINELKAMIISNQTSINNQQSTVISSASLQQNVPNPFNHSTTINYSLPQKFTNAQIIITDKLGNTLKAVNVSGSGKGSLNVDAATLAAGAYNYSLMIDGKLIATKQMILAR